MKATSIQRDLGRAALLALACSLSGNAFAHDDDPKIVQRQPATPGSGFARGLALGQPLPGGGVNTQFMGGGNPMFPSQGVTLRSWLTLGDLGGAGGGSDIWGYASPSGREYAIIGTTSGVNVVEVTDPDLPSIIATIAGPNSTWRDIRTYQNRAYVVSEGGSGIQVLDLSNIDSGAVVLESTVTTGGNSSTHNVSLDTVSGFLYRCGGGSNGLRIYDLTNPANPTFVVSWSDRYVHDAQIVTYTSGPLAGKQIAYCCGGLNGGWVDPTLTILDVTDKQNILLLSQLPYPGRVYSHQGWLSEDRMYYYLGDELDENGTISTTTFVFNVADPSNASYVSSFVNGTVAVGHNMFTAHGLLFQANYTSGLRIFDVASNPVSPQEIGYFDTAPNSTAATYNGLWGCYPFLPSRTILCSDRESGLFVLTYEPPIGQGYCTAAANSTGMPASLDALGSPFVADNDLDLVATGLPPSVTTLFVVSAQQGFVTGLGGGQGNLCLSGAIGRYTTQVGMASPAGTSGLDVDVLQVPQPSSFVSVQPGETWNFQCWYRDSNPGVTSNLSSGYAVRFR